MSTLVALLHRANLELMLAATTGMVCLMAIVAGMRSLVGGRDEIAERLERVRRDGGDGQGARIGSRLEPGASPAAILHSKPHLPG